MREFKFIRGIYTNENIFNTDEISNCLFAYDSEGELVSFNEVNNDGFQQKFLSPDRISKIYTFRPNQFTVSATKEGNSYPFTFVANEMTYDNSEVIPPNVKEAAEAYIESQTTANIKTTGSIPKLNIEGNPIEKTTVEFTFGDKTTFTRNLVFKVSGKLVESGYLLANGEDITAYSDITVIGSAKQGAFYNGHFQSKVSSKQKDVILDPLEVSNAGNLKIATSYTPKDGFIFVVNGQIKSSVDYSDNLEFLLYTETPNDSNTITENGTTYYYVGKCTVMSRNDKIVKGYETSYAGKYVLKDSKLIQVTESDLIENNLTDGKLDIYNSDEYHIISNNVYEDDSSDTKDYFMHIDENNPLVKNITNENAYVNENGVVSPLITEHIFRQITDINVTATQSDD